jgi:ribonuclease P protein component
MLARFYTLKGEVSFKRVQKEGRLRSFDSFGLSVYERGDAEHSNFGFVVSTKISKESASRHRIARALSEAIRLMLMEIRPGYDVVFLAKPVCLKKSTEELMREVHPAMEKAKLLK